MRRKAALLRQQAAAESPDITPLSKEGSWLRSCTPLPHRWPLVLPCQHQHRFHLAAACSRRLSCPAEQLPAAGPAAGSERRPHLARRRPAAVSERRPQLHVKTSVKCLMHIEM